MAGLIALVIAALIPVAVFADPVTRGDLEQFESCFGSFEGARAVLPQLEMEFDPANYRDLGEAMDDLAMNFATLESRLADSGLKQDAAARDRARLVGRLPWTKPENRTAAYWSVNGPMSRPCFELIKRLNQTLGP